MGHDYSYSQPDSSDQYAEYTEDTEDREIAALVRMDEAESSFIHQQPTQYPPQPEVEFGFPKVCYCGGQPLISSSNNRRFFTCGNIDDGEMHIHKWWDEAVMEEMREMDRACKMLNEKVDSLTFWSDNEIHLSNASEEKLLKLEKLVAELGSNRNWFRNGFELVVLVLAIVVAMLGLVVIYN